MKTATTIVEQIAKLKERGMAIEDYKYKDVRELDYKNTFNKSVKHHSDACIMYCFFLSLHHRKKKLQTTLFKNLVMNTIKVSKNGINVKVSVFLYLDTEHPDKDMFIAFCPSLNLVGYGNGEEKAKKDFEWIMKDYLNEMTAQGTLEQDLLSHGWKAAQKTFKEPMVSDMLNTNEQLKNVVNGNNYHKITCTAYA